MPKITFLGAGSMVFATKIAGDILTFDTLTDSDIVLMDIDKTRLAKTQQVVETLADNAGLDATVEVTTDRIAALRDADYVLNMINVGGTEPFENEIRIPEEYGVKQAIGDTIGPGGIFRALRTIPIMLDIAADIEAVCPDALLMNYTNPMSILCQTMYEATNVKTVGLCHSVPHTAEALAEYIGVSEDDLEYWVAGINHIAWFLKAEYHGKSIYPALQKAMADPAIYEKDTVRFEMMRHFGYFPTESSHHMSEYVPYFRTNEDTIEEMTGTEYAERMPTGTYLKGWMERSTNRDNADLDSDLDGTTPERSEEYASRLIHSIETGTPRRMNLNVHNTTGAITNLPTDICVEVPCLVDGQGITPCSVGELPSEVAAFPQRHAAIHQLVVKGALEHDREIIHQAVKLDPLTGAALPLNQIHEMTEDLLVANERYLPRLE